MDDTKRWNAVQLASMNIEGDNYNAHGINISAHARRQELIKWSEVRYSKSKKKARD